MSSIIPSSVVASRKLLGAVKISALSAVCVIRVPQRPKVRLPVCPIMEWACSIEVVTRITQREELFALVFYIINFGVEGVLTNVVTFPVLVFFNVGFLKALIS